MTVICHVWSSLPDVIHNSRRRTPLFIQLFLWLQIEQTSETHGSVPAHKLPKLIRLQESLKGSWRWNGKWWTSCLSKTTSCHSGATEDSGSTTKKFWNSEQVIRVHPYSIKLHRDNLRLLYSTTQCCAEKPTERVFSIVNVITFLNTKKNKNNDWWWNTGLNSFVD